MAEGLTAFMAAPLLTEEQHRGYLEKWMELAGSLNEKRLPEEIRNFSALARDSLHIARDVGYESLYQEFEPLYNNVGL